ncbi:MAG TPA: hypothetical protein VH854_09425, partial [Thermoanaerobaculia bacterium]|nr:hypothetical protein [Thermoanaerobaculia bacterium]
MNLARRGDPPLASLGDGPRRKFRLAAAAVVALATLASVPVDAAETQPAPSSFLGRYIFRTWGEEQGLL